MKTIANIMHVLNEAEFVEAAIRSVLPGVDQLIVIDQGSTDGTVDILDDLYAELRDDPSNLCHFVWASSLGHTFLTRGEQFFRNLAIDLCFCDWLMITDGDEIMGDGWEKIVRPFMDECGDKYGAIRCNYWQMVGTSGYHTPDSPLNPEAGIRPVFLRKNENLRSGQPMTGTKVHNSIEGITPLRFARLSDVDVFHMGYTKSDLTTRFNRNIERGDWTQEEEHKKAFYESAKKEPLALLQDCVPITFPIERLPASIREPKFRVDYDQATRRITARTPII